MKTLQARLSSQSHQHLTQLAEQTDLPLDILAGQILDLFSLITSSQPVSVRLHDLLQHQQTNEPHSLQTASAVAPQLLANLELLAQTYLNHRAKRGSWERFQQILAHVPDVEAEPYDRL